MNYRNRLLGQKNLMSLVLRPDNLHGLPVVVLGPGHLGLIVQVQQGAGQVQIQNILGWARKSKESTQKLTDLQSE